LVAVDAQGETVLIDDEPAPGVFLVRPGQKNRELLPWGKASALALSPSGRLAALGYPHGEVRVYDVMTQTQVAQHDWKRGAVTALCFIGSSRIAIGASSQVRVWEWETGEVLPTPIDLPGTLTALAPDRDGKRLAAASDDALHVIDVESGRRIVGQLKGPAVAKCLAWEGQATQTVCAYDVEGVMHTFAMPPPVERAPPWLPDWIEHHCGVRIDNEARLVRLRAVERSRLPAEAANDLKAWLLGNPQ
jgi:WD40 repeat protein